MSDVTITAIYDGELPQDVLSTIRCLASLGVAIDRLPGKLTIEGVGIKGWRQPDKELDCGNSGTTSRLLMGCLTGQQISATLVGDRSLSQRPMRRLADLLIKHFNADITFYHRDGLPLTVRGKRLDATDVTLSVASAQMKSALLLAALQARGVSRITEPARTRDHTERMLRAFGVAIGRQETTLEINSRGFLPLRGSIDYHVPADISAAYYLIVAAILKKHSLRLHTVSLNPTRTRFLEILSSTFANISYEHWREEWNEPVGDILITPKDLQPIDIKLNGADIPLLIDELPLLAVLAANSEGRLEISDARELRMKESDRISLIVSNLRLFGVVVEEREDGFIVEGNPGWVREDIRLDHGGDHRIALAFSLMAARARVTIRDPAVVDVSFPNFFREVGKILGDNRFSLEA